MIQLHTTEHNCPIDAAMMISEVRGIIVKNNFYEIQLILVAI